MALMENVIRAPNSGIYKVRRRIPADCLEAFGVKEFVTVSLGTKDKREAQRLAIPILEEIDRKIAATRALQADPAPVLDLQPHPLIDRQTALNAIEKWRRASIQSAHDRAWNGFLKPLGQSQEAVDASRLRYRLDNPREPLPDDFRQRFAAALTSQGVNISPDHPVLDRTQMVQAFRSAWLDVERFTDDFRHDRFDGWPEGQETTVPQVVAPTQAKSGMKLLAVFDLWAQTRPTQPRQRGYVKRLSEFLGDPDISDITALDLDRFLVALRDWPVTKRPLDDVPFDEVIRRFQAEGDYQRLHIKTVWNWTTVFKALFDFAVDRDLIAKNPAAKTMKKPSAAESEERPPYSGADIAAIFAKPMFQGASSDRAYRVEPGSIVTRDHRFWLPILALWTGARLEELATLTREEIKVEEGVHLIDLTGRPIKAGAARRVKNSSAQRLIPIHDRLIAIGFLDHLRGLKPRDMIFPELNPDTDKVGRYFTRWWGMWCEANADVKGEGFDDPRKVFHSFRHSWKGAARNSPAKEEIHDLISGHKGGNAVARGYGRGAHIAKLKEAMDLIDFPTFVDPK